MSIWSRVMYGLQSGMSAMRQALFEDPLQRSRRLTWSDMASVYDLLWAYYDNSLFENDVSIFNKWLTYKQQQGLYRNTRSLYNPVHSLVEFYVEHIYPGVFPSDAATLPEGMRLAIPFKADTPPEVLAAIGQFWQWSNWASRNSLMIRYSAALGSTLVELIDDIDHGKVTTEIWKPGVVRDIMLDSSGNVKMYTLEYLVQDENESYTYRKFVDGNAFQYFKDDEPVATLPNPYGFVPAVWIKHGDMGSDRGSAAFVPYHRLDRLNSLASHFHDHIHKVIAAPLVFWSSTTPQSMFSTKKRGPSDEQLQPNAEQENLLVLHGSTDGHVDSLAGNLPIAEVAAYISDLLAEIEKDHPELTFYEKLLGMTQVTGPAIERIMGNVEKRVLLAATEYDRASTALFQMALAIGGFRANGGAWGALTSQQQKFTPFSLDSYARGELDFTILPRPLLMPTRYERALEMQAIWTGVGQAVTAGAPLDVVLKEEEGWTDEQLAQLGQAQVDKIKRDQLLAQEDTIPPIGQ